MTKIFFFALFIYVNLGVSTHVFAQRYFKGRVYETWLKQKDSMKNNSESSNPDFLKPSTNTITIDKQTYRYTNQVEPKLTGKKITYKGGYYVFEDDKVAFSNYSLLKEYCIASNCKKAFSHVNSVRAIGILASIGIAGAAVWLADDLTTSNGSSGGSGIQTLYFVYIGGAVVGLSLPISKKLAQRSVLKRYNKCIETADIENKKSLLPTDIKLGFMPSQQGNVPSVGFVWKF
jgi:hypothetical protein